MSSLRRLPIAASVVDVAGDYNSPSANIGMGGRHGHYMLTGFGCVTNEQCGVFVGTKGCLDHKKHEEIFKKSAGQATLGGKAVFDKMRWLGAPSVKNKVFVHCVVHHCYNSACPLCYVAWAEREAGKAEQRLREAERRFSGRAEHYILSFDPYSPENKLLDSEGGLREYFKKVHEATRARGIVGSFEVFHGFRFDWVYRHWYWSPHVHLLSFRRNGYDCRRCKKVGCASAAVCGGCRGFEAVTRRCWKKDGAIVKIAVDREGEFRERDSLFATILYELKHGTIRDDVKRAHCCWWSGTVSYRKLKVVIEKRESVCPFCGKSLVWLTFVGSGHIETHSSAVGFKTNFIDEMFDDGGGERWVESPKRSYVARFIRGEVG